MSAPCEPELEGRRGGREALVARGRQIYQSRKLAPGAAPALTPLRRTPPECAQTPLTGANAPALVDARAPEGSEYEARAASTPRPRAAAPDFLLPSLSGVSTAATMTPFGGSCECTPSVIAGSTPLSRAPLAAVGSAQSFLLQAVSSRAAEVEHSSATSDDAAVPRLCEHLGAFQAALEEVRLVEDAHQAEQSRSHQTELLLELSAHGRLVITQANRVLEHLRCVEGSRQDAQLRLGEAKAENERLTKKIEIYKKRCSVVSEELAETTSALQEVDRARAERNELRDSMSRAIDAVTAEKEAAERRAALAEAALHSSSTCLGNAHSHASSEAADALNLQRWSSFIGHDTAREAADAALRSTSKASNIERSASADLPIDAVSLGNGVSADEWPTRHLFTPSPDHKLNRTISNNSNAAKAEIPAAQEIVCEKDHSNSLALESGGRNEESQNGEGCDGEGGITMVKDGGSESVGVSGDDILIGSDTLSGIDPGSGLEESNKTSDSSGQAQPSKLAQSDSGTQLVEPLLGFPKKFELCKRFVEEGPLRQSADVSDSDWLLLDALQQQALHGPCHTPSPGYLSSTAEERAKWRAWKELGNKSAVEAMYLYTQAVQELDSRWWAWLGLGVRDVRTMEVGTAGDSSEIVNSASNGITEGKGSDACEASCRRKEDNEPHVEGHCVTVAAAEDRAGLPIPDAQNDDEMHTTVVLAAAEDRAGLPIKDAKKDNEMHTTISFATPADSRSQARSPATAEGLSIQGTPGQFQVDTDSYAAAENDVDLEWRIEVIMRQHAEDCKRMTPSDAARFAKQALAAIGIHGSASTGSAQSLSSAPPQTPVWSGTLLV